MSRDRHPAKLCKLWLMACVLVLAPSCSLVLESQPRQCESNEDCRAKGGAFAEASCNEGMCIAPDASSAQCQTSSECGAQGKAICRNGACTPLLSTECTSVLGEPASGVEPVLLGALLPLSGPNAAIGTAVQNGCRMAIDEINAVANGLPVGQGAPRPLRLVVCDDASDPARAIGHLHGLAVPAIVGAVTEGVTATAVASIAASDLLLMTPADRSGLAALDDKRLIWRTGPADWYQALAISRHVEDLEAQVRSTLGVAPSEPIKLAVVHSGDARGVALQAEVALRAQFNGKPALENGDSFVVTSYGDPSAPQSQLEQSCAVSAAIVLNTRPHILVLAGGAEGVKNVLGYVEQNWTAMVSYKPLVIATDQAKVDALLQLASSLPDLRSRLSGAAPGTSNPAFLTFQQSYSQRFAVDDPRLLEASAAYDAVYASAYAWVASGETSPTGTKLADSIGSLVPPASALPAGSASLLSGFDALRAGKSIDMAGASGPLDFDLGTGDASSDIQIWCVDGSGGSPSFKDSGRFLDAESGLLTGILSCP